MTIPEVPDAVSAKGRLGGVAPGKLALETLYIAKAMPKNAQANFPMPDWRVIGGQDAQLSEWYSD